MISVTGMPTLLALQLVDATRDTQTQMIRSSARNARAIEHFNKNIGAVETVDQLVDDPELYGFVMRAFDLEDQIFGKALMKKVLKSNIEEPNALVNRLTDPRFRALYKEMGFGTDGVGNINTALTAWRGRMVDRFVERQYINSNADQNETLGTALEFRRTAATIETPFDILKDAALSKFFRTALGMPAQTAGLDIDRQAALIDRKFDLSKLKDPAEVEKLIKRYVAISDATDGTASSNNAAVQLMQGAVNSASGFVPVVIDITAVVGSNFSAYKTR
ncbi:DUF1217 domain-containing protein [Brevirhabdus sp.]|uniref:DUF1217 domain-containing protein n=1 Tax=Brevirhabdus sp. TaxID=2004514 RepID=UPI004058CC7A